MPADGPDAFCRACRLNRTIPDLGPPDHLLRWQRLEAAKHRLVYALLRLGLPVVSKFEDPQAGLAFDFLADSGATFRTRPQVMTGHAKGLITIDIAEADDAERERARKDMAEPYRTLLGHFRHEVGHYYWDRLVRDGLWLDAFRTLFGDERQDYGALPRRRTTPRARRRTGRSASSAATPAPIPGRTSPRPGRTTCTSSTRWRPPPPSVCASAPMAGRDPALATEIDFDPYQQGDFDALLQAWLPLTYAVNSLNQSMGQPDLYPFVLAPAVMGKLRFVHGLIRERGM